MPLFRLVVEHSHQGSRYAGHIVSYSWHDSVEARSLNVELRVYMTQIVNLLHPIEGSIFRG